MNKIILSLITCFGILIISNGVHADEVCYSVDGEIKTTNFGLTQTGKIELNLSSVEFNDVYLEGIINGEITSFVPVKLAHDITSSEDYEVEIHTDDDTPIVTGAPDGCSIPVLEISSQLDAYSESTIGGKLVTKFNLVVQGDLALLPPEFPGCPYPGENVFEEISGVICTEMPIE